jgi:2-dehydropantoate 2-reductase
MSTSSSSSERPRVLVVGCGGVGGVIAARLTRAGHDVTAITGNRAIAEAIATHGYRVTEFDGEVWSVPASAPPKVELAAGDGPFDVCIVATKSTTLATALRSALPLLTPDAPVLVCQNGLPENIAAEVVGEARVLGCVVVWGASMSEPGAYLRTSRGSFKLGRPFATSPDPEPMAKLLDAVAAVEIESDLLGARWSKLAINCATSTLGAIGGEKLGPLLRRRFVRRLVLELWTEIVDVARAAGVKPASVAGLSLARIALTPGERQLALGSPVLAGKHALLMAVGVKYRRMRSSMLIAIERGRTPEIDFLNGEVVRRGAALGVPTPVNARLARAVMDICGGIERPSVRHLRLVYDEVMGEVGAAGKIAA